MTDTKTETFDPFDNPFDRLSNACEALHFVGTVACNAGFHGFGGEFGERDWDGIYQILRYVESDVSRACAEGETRLKAARADSGYDKGRADGSRMADLEYKRGLSEGIAQGEKRERARARAIAEALPGVMAAYRDSGQADTDGTRPATAPEAAPDAAPDAGQAAAQETYPRIAKRLPARDAAIAGAIAEGHSVATVARAVNMKQAEVAKVVERLRGDGALAPDRAGETPHAVAC